MALLSYIKKEQLQKIVVRMPNWIGDAVMATAALQDIRHFFSHASITVMCQGSIGDLLIHDPHIDRILRFEKISGWLKPQTHGAMYNLLSKENFDAGILFPLSFSSAWWFWLAGIPYRLGFKTHGRSLLLKPAILLPPNIEETHLVNLYKELLRPLGIPKSTTSPQIFLNKEEEADGENFIRSLAFSQESKVIGLNPSAAFGSAKCWLPERFRALIERFLRETPHTIVCFGDSASQGMVNEIIIGFGPRVISLAGKTNLRQLISYINALDLFISNDSGPMHIAAALHTPLIALFGSTSPIKTGPFGFGKVIYKKTSCSPCYKRHCPIDFRCMTEIKTDEVFDISMKELEQCKETLSI